MILLLICIAMLISAFCTIYIMMGRIEELKMKIDSYKKSLTLAENMINSQTEIISNIILPSPPPITTITKFPISENNWEEPEDWNRCF